MRETTAGVDTSPPKVFQALTSGEERGELAGQLEVTMLRIDRLVKETDPLRWLILEHCHAARRFAHHREMKSALRTRLRQRRLFA